MTIIGYLKQELDNNGDFLKEFKRLSQAERDSLREDARVEMAARGIKISPTKLS